MRSTSALDTGAPSVGARRRLRILHVSQPTDGGCAIAVRFLAEAGTRAGHTVTVACPRQSDLPGWITDVGAHWHPLPMVRWPAPGDISTALRMRRLFERADVVHLHSSKAGALGRLALRSLGKRAPASCFTPHGWSWLVGGPMAPAYRTYERVAAAWTDVIVAVSEEEAAAGRGVLRPGFARMTVIPNGVDTERFCVEGPRASRSAQPLIVCAGRLTVQKGQDLGIRALAHLQTAGARLRLVGEGPDTAKLRELAAALGVADRVEFTGHCDPRPHLRAADVVLLPSRWEGLSFVLLEAMACGKAIVATAVAGSGVVGDAGVVVPPAAGPEGLAAALDELLADEPTRRRHGERARIRVCEHFAAERMLTAHLALWEALAEAASGAGGARARTTRGTASRSR
ncbi:MAG: glycosyltransferase family 4 protein [Actinobacteria bacterium]|nr:MAG: glycosyltransferase family 4 protein [Actinomycetota bacterium]